MLLLMANYPFEKREKMLGFESHMSVHIKF